MKTRLITLLAALAAISTAHAAVLVSFDMSTITGSGATKGISASAFDAGLTTTILGKNNVTSASPINTVLYGGNAAGTWTTATAQATINVATTLSNANYITFTITPLAGNQIDITSITFGAAASNNTNTRAIYLLSSATGFTSSDVLLSDSTSVAGVGGSMVRRADGVLKSYSYIASTPAFTGITTPVEFRIYLQTALANQDIDFDNIIVNGSVSAIAVPEPASFATFSAVAVLGAVATRRRRR